MRNASTFNLISSYTLNHGYYRMKIKRKMTFHHVRVRVNKMNHKIKNLSHEFVITTEYGAFNESYRYGNYFFLFMILTGTFTQFEIST